MIIIKQCTIIAINSQYSFALYICRIITAGGTGDFFIRSNGLSIASFGPDSSDTYRLFDPIFDICNKWAPFYYYYYYYFFLTLSGVLIPNQGY